MTRGSWPDISEVRPTEEASADAVEGNKAGAEEDAEADEEDEADDDEDAAAEPAAVNEFASSGFSRFSAGGVVSAHRGSISVS